MKPYKILIFISAAYQIDKQLGANSSPNINHQILYPQDKIKQHIFRQKTQPIRLPQEAKQQSMFINKTQQDLWHT